jgi:phosphatidate cytidylyltransferase
VLVAIPAATVLAVLLGWGGLPWAVAMLALAILGAVELARLGRRAGWRPGSTAALAVGWLGVGFGHAVLVRELPHGAELTLAVLLATFLGDTAAQFAGTAFGRRPLAPRISPNKSVEGAVAGIAGGTLAVLAMALVLDEPWLSTWEALALGLACSLAAPAGDLFESSLKRRAGVKDSGRLFGAHGGVLDRVDAALAAAVTGHWVALWVVI